MSAVMSIESKRGNQLDPELQHIDQLAERWWRITREGRPLSSNPIARAVAEAEGAALATGEEWIDDEVLAFDKTLASSPPRVKLFVPIWYGSGSPAEAKASRLGVSRAALYVEWKATLWFLRGRLWK